jgi:hypothetical protein
MLALVLPAMRATAPTAPPAAMAPMSSAASGGAGNTGVAWLVCPLSRRIAANSGIWTTGVLMVLILEELQSGPPALGSQADLDGLDDVGPDRPGTGGGRPLRHLRFETMRLVEDGARLYAVLNVVASVLAGFGAAALGYALGQGL